METDIYRQSLSIAVLPNIWKTAYVWPIFKKGAVWGAENYGPVRLHPPQEFSAYHLLTSQETPRLTRALSPWNYGFRKHHACDTQLILTIQGLLIWKDLGRIQVDIGVLDFARAFDKVPQGRLFSKLRICGIDGEVAQWIESFLHDRTQAEIVDGSTSGQVQLHSVVKQSTVLWPL